MCVCCSFEHFVIATGVSYISAGFSNKSISSAGWFRLQGKCGPLPFHHLRPWGPEFDSPSRPPTSVLFGEPRHSPNRYQDVQLHTTSASELPVMGPTEILTSPMMWTKPPHDAHMLWVSRTATHASHATLKIRHHTSSETRMRAR